MHRPPLRGTSVRSAHACCGAWARSRAWRWRGAAFFVAEPEANGWDTPARLGMPSARVEVFCTEPDAFIARAVAAGADGHRDPIRDHQMPWGIHRQGGFVDPFGHIWLVGDRSPLQAHPQ